MIVRSIQQQRWILPCCLALLVLTLPAGHLRAAPIVLGVVSNNVENAQELWGSFAARLGEELPPAVGPLILKIFNSHSGLLWQIWEGGVHAFIAEPVMALSLAENADASPSAILAWHERAREQACLAVQASSAIKSIADAAGHVVAFDHPSSTFGHAIPRLLLTRAGLQVEERDGDKPIAGDTVAYSYTMDKYSPLIWLYRSRVDIAASSRRQIDQVNRNRPGMLRVLECSEPLPHTILAIAPNLKVQQSLNTALRALQDKVATGRIETIDDETGLAPVIDAARHLINGS